MVVRCPAHCGSRPQLSSRASAARQPLTIARRPLCTPQGNTDTSEELYGTANQTASEAFSSIRVIHAYNMNDSMIGAWGELRGGSAGGG